MKRFVDLPDMLLAVLCLAALGTGIMLYGCSWFEPAPNLLLVSIDTLRADALGAYGHPGSYTPFLDRLAREGAQFERVISAIPHTTPSHGTILSGLYPLHHGSRDNAFPIGKNVRTLAQHLRDLEYDSAGFVAHFLLSPEYSGLDRGFSLYTSPEVPEYLKQTDGAGHGMLLPNDYLPATDISEQALDWLDAAAPPFMLFLHFYDCHKPYRPITPYTLVQEVTDYQRELMRVDRELESVVRRLAELDQLKHTVIHITADHGESMGEHGYSGHGKYLYYPSLEVPWIAWDRKGILRGIVPGLARSVDIMPTVMAQMGFELLGTVDGVSRLKPAVNSGAGEQIAFSESGSSWHRELNRRIRSVRSPESTLILGEPSGVREMYESGPDPAETNNVFDQPRIRLERASLSGIISMYLTEDTAQAPDPESELDPATKDALKALGYLTE